MAKWTDDEKDILSRHYPTEGSMGCSMRLPSRKKQSIRVKAFEMGLKVDKGTVLGWRSNGRWTDEDNSVLLSHYQTDGVLGCMGRLKNKTEYSIAHQAKKLGLKIYKECSRPTGVPRRGVLGRTANGNPICKCPYHGECEHVEYKSLPSGRCVPCQKERDKGKKQSPYNKDVAKKWRQKRRKIPIHNYIDRMRRAIRKAFVRIGSGCKPGCFRHLSYSHKDLFDHIEGVRTEQKNRCPMCCKEYVGLGFDIDHVIPLCTAKTLEQVLGLFSLSNLSLLCPTCNRHVKRDKIVGENL